MVAELGHFSPGDKLDLLVGLQRQLSDAEFQQVADAFASSGVALGPVESGYVKEWDAPEVLRFRFQIPSMASGQGYSFLPVSIVAVKGISDGQPQGYGSWYNPASWGFWPWNWFNSGTAKKFYAGIGGGAVGTIAGVILTATALKTASGATKALTILSCGVAGFVAGYAIQAKWKIIK